MNSIILFIDGENFLAKIEEVLKRHRRSNKEIDIAGLDLNQILSPSLKKYHVNQKRFYAARLHEHPGSLKKSRYLINRQRRLKSNLEKQGFTFIKAGNVRAQLVTLNGKRKYIFKEKGVDVRLAVDMVSMACAGKLSTAIIGSSDSDLQPVIADLRQRQVKVIYLGFTLLPNKGLTYTCNQTILINDTDIINSLPSKSQAYDQS